MTSAAKKPRKQKKPGGVTGYISNAYRNTMDASEKVSVIALNLPYIFLEGVGIPEEKTQGMKNLNTKVVGGIYSGTDWLTTRAVGAYIAPFKWVGKGVQKLTGSSEKKPAKKAEKKPKAKKAAPKKVAAKRAAPKKAPKAKRAPPKVAARKPLKVEDKPKVDLAA